MQEAVDARRGGTEGQARFHDTQCSLCWFALIGAFLFESFLIQRDRTPEEIQKEQEEHQAARTKAAEEERAAKKAKKAEEAAKKKAEKAAAKAAKEAETETAPTEAKEDL
jgi:hypothetical protein